MSTEIGWSGLTGATPRSRCPGTPGDFDNGDIYARNLKTGKEYQVTNFKNNELYPKVENGMVYFRAWSDKGLDIFAIDLKKRLGL